MGNPLEIASLAAVPSMACVSNPRIGPVASIYSKILNATTDFASTVLVVPCAIIRPRNDSGAIEEFEESVQLRLSMKIRCILRFQSSKIQFWQKLENGELPFLLTASNYPLAA